MNKSFPGTHFNLNFPVEQIHISTLTPKSLNFFCHVYNKYQSIVQSKKNNEMKYLEANFCNKIE